MNPHTKNQILAHLAEAQRLLAPSIDLQGPRTVAEDVNQYIVAAQTNAEYL